MFFPTPFLMDLVRKRGFWETHFSKLRPCVRPSVQTPTDLESVDFASPKTTLPPVKALFFAKSTTANATGIDTERARRKACEFFPNPFLLDLVCKRGFRETHFPKLRPRTRPSRRQWLWNRSISPHQKWRYLLSKRFVFSWNSQQSYFSCCVTPTGASYFSCCVTPTRANKYIVDTAGIDSVRPRRKERVFFTTLFLRAG